MPGPDASPPWLEPWLKTQQGLWQQFFQGGGSPPPAAPPWGPWMGAGMGLGMPPGFGPPPPSPPNADVLRRLMDFGGGYLGVVQEFWQAIDRANRGGGTSLGADLEQLQRLFTQGFGQLPQAAGMPFGDMLAQWQRLMPQGAQAAGGDPLARLLGAPAVGITREQQEAMQRLTQASLAVQQAWQRHAEMLGRVGTQAVARMTEKIGELSGAGKPLESLRAVHDLWVECGEKAYAELAHGKEFATAQAELSGALAALKKEQQALAEDWAKSFDLPTRGEMNTLLKRVNTLKRRLRELEDDLEKLRRGRGG